MGVHSYYDWVKNRRPVSQTTRRVWNIYYVLDGIKDVYCGADSEERVRKEVAELEAIGATDIEVKEKTVTHTEYTRPGS